MEGTAEEKARREAMCLARSLGDTHSQEGWHAQCTRWTLWERGSTLCCSGPPAVPTVGQAEGWCWEDGAGVLVSERDELLERLREAVFLPQPRDGSLCRYSTVSFILYCHGRTAFHLSEFS